MSATSLEHHFSKYRNNTIGSDHTFSFQDGEMKIVYADWTASGRGYHDIEQRLQRDVIPFFANTHTQTTSTGRAMTRSYEEAKATIKKHVNANDNDVLIFTGSGMTSAVNKLQRLLGIRLPEGYLRYLKKGKSIDVDEELRPVVFVTSMEHHSNHVSWLETIATVEVIGQDEEGYVDVKHLETLLLKHQTRKNKIVSMSACSNVTGIQTPYHEIAKLVHGYGGLCFVDFAASAPYVKIDMHPEDPSACLDAIFFSMHKFLGGPGTPGVLIFNKEICNNNVPDHPGGGTLLYSNPWGGREYTGDIESREDGGTPPVLQAIKAAMCIDLKEEMGIEEILLREAELIEIAFERLHNMRNVKVLQGNIRERLGIISFIVDGAHYNLIVKILNDRFGIQMRGGCSCAGTYGHTLLNVPQSQSFEIWQAISSGDMSSKPGWIRLSLHPTMTNHELEFIMDAIELTASNFRAWMADYEYDPSTNEFYFNSTVRL
ncbi:MAG: aminotransferase class V-fold PLP-dependent enzyme [Bacteroidota bacterium]